MSSTPVVLITGAARRVGAEIARTLHAAGMNIMLNYRSREDEAAALATVLNKLRPGSAKTAFADLRNVAELEQLVAQTVADFGRLDALVNNASAFYPTPVGQIDAEAWDELVGSNFKGPLFLSQAAVPHLATQGGCIVNITDIHAERPLKGYALYCAAKAGLLGLTRALAVELGPQIRVNAVAPGPIEWPEDDSFSPFEQKAIIDHTLLKRSGTPADIAGAVKFLLLDAPYVTGQVLNVDGGRTAHL